MKAPPFLIVTRAHAGEIPFLRTFCEHYIKIGADRLVFVVNDESTSNALMRILPERTQAFVQIVTCGDNIEPEPCIRLMLQEFGMERAMVARFDCDEYLELPTDAASFSELWLRQPFDYLQLPWLLISSDDEKGRDSGFWSASPRQGKYIVRADAVAEFRIHIPRFNQRSSLSPDTPPDGTRLVHYWGRNLLDTVLKTMLPNNGLCDKKNIYLDSLSSLVKLGDLPPRLKIHAYLCLHERNVPQRDLLERGIDTGALRRLLAGAPGGQSLCEALTCCYYNYKRQLESMGFKNDRTLYPQQSQRLVDLVLDKRLPPLVGSAVWS